MVLVYYCIGNPSNNISSVALKYYVGFQKVTSEPLEHSDFVDPQGNSWRSPYQTKKNWTILKSRFVKVNPKRNKDIVVSTVCVSSKNNLSQRIHQCFGHALITSLSTMVIKVLMQGITKNLPDVEEP